MNKFLIVLIFSVLFISLVESIDREKDCSCSVSRNQTTNEGSYSWIANLYEEGIFKCSGAIVNEYLVIFSRNCLKDMDGNLLVTVGEMKQNEKLDKISKSNSYKVKFVNFASVDYNVGLVMMRLESPIEFTNTIKPSCLEQNKNKEYYVPFNLVGFVKKGELNEVAYQDVSKKAYCSDSIICARKNVQKNKSEIEFNSSGLAQYDFGNNYTTLIGLVARQSFDKSKVDLVRIGVYFQWISNYAQGDVC